MLSDIHHVSNCLVRPFATLCAGASATGHLQHAFLPIGRAEGNQMSRSMPRIVGLGLLCVVIAFLSVSGTTQAEYEMKRVSVTGVADRLASSNYRMSVTSEPLGGAAGTCPNGSVNSLGFWSVLGPMAVPMRLTVDKNAAYELDVDLSWTGHAPSFEIYRSTSPVNLISPDNLYWTTNYCDDTDENAASSDVLFYKIIARPDIDNSQ